MEIRQPPRMVQEYVPGKQITLAHLIAHPIPELARKLGLAEGPVDAIGILTITPSEAAIIAADTAAKTARGGNRLCGPFQRLSAHHR